MSRLPTRCCRSTPRCAGCPVRLALEARARQLRAEADGRAALVDEILRGGTRSLPPPVVRALDELAEARAAHARERLRAIV